MILKNSFGVEVERMVGPERTRLVCRLERPARAIPNALGETLRLAHETCALPEVKKGIGGFKNAAGVFCGASSGVPPATFENTL